MDQVALIRDKIDIVALIGEYITVKKAGRNFKAICPFHNEKSPSFVISPERQIWHCFGCAKGGDAYTFLMEYEHMEFPEALRSLAKRTGVELVQSQREMTTTSRKETLYMLNQLAAEFYHYVLTKLPAGKQALLYLTNRGISPKVIESFKIGFSPTGNALSKYLMQKKKYQAVDLLDAGLVFQRGRDTVDFFRGRIMFPLFDHRENILGFSGRILTESASGPKYINTRDTLIYHKGEMFFGLNMTKDAIRKQNQAIIVEGEFDVLSCFQEGISNVVAVKGTALTDQQVNLLARFVQKITMCLDGDSAGQEAIKRSLPILEKKQLTTTVIVIPGGKDPDEALKNDAGAFKAAVKHDVPIYDFLLTQAAQAVDIQTPDGKKRVAGTMLPIIAGMQNEIVKEHYLRKLSSELDTTYESIVKELQRQQRKEAPLVTIKKELTKRSREEVLEEYLVALILQSSVPKVALEKTLEILSASIIKERAQQKILDHLLAFFEKQEQFDSKNFGSNLPQELVSTYDTCLLFPLPTFPDEVKQMREVVDTAMKLREMYVKEKINVLSLAIKQKEKEGESAEIDVLKSEFSRFANMLTKN